MAKLDERFLLEHHLEEIEQWYQESVFAANQAITLLKYDQESPLF